ncbi:hypothetical protein QYE76_060494 [Lolium multiflorum]|uniref:RNase H type-1 domain-containing protein n=1 Tax=Lolium multiflorum TaxID=4521 RepID=A0AAD8RZ70_LOLMU|nr:hypothetical protein QYE76_060494 [Lolium multiflorum]
MENYSLLMGAAAVMKMAVEMAAVSMEKPSGALLRRRAGTETSVPELGFAMVALGRLGPEDVLHLLFTCPAAQEIWRHLGISNIIDEATQVDRSGSTGAIIRDHRGGCVVALFLSQYVASPLMAEAIAMREGLALAIKMGCRMQ